jgi:uncharacterized protein (DUF1697 family)
MRRYAALLPGIIPGGRNKVTMAGLRQVAASPGHTHVATAVRRTLSLRAPDGLGRSELAAQLAQSGGQAGGGHGRNWATVTRLMAMLDSAA